MAAWHGGAVDGTYYFGEDAHSIPVAPAVGAHGHATGLLNVVAVSATEAADLINNAHTANAVVRGFDEVKETA